MRNFLAKIAGRLSASYWFIPTILVIGAMFLAVLTLQIDVRYSDSLVDIITPLLQATSAGVRSVLTTIAGSVITLAGTVFSLTMVVLTLAAQQYGPLVVSNFMRDRTNQFALGVFLATFVYCILILPTIDGGDSTFVPVLSGLVAVTLALIDAGLLIYFIHHVSESVQPTYIIGQIGNRLDGSLKDVYPEHIGDSADNTRQLANATLLPDFDTNSAMIHSETSGYMQLIDGIGVMDLATSHDLVIQVMMRPGMFVLEGAILARVYPAEALTAKIKKHLHDTMILGNERTLIQDSDLMVTQLEQIALRALSPSLNDPYTAMMSIDRLGQVLMRMIHDGEPDAYRFDEAGNLRIITDPLDFEELLHLSFDGIINHGASDPTVMGYILKTFTLLAESKPAPRFCRIIHDYTKLIPEMSAKHIDNQRALQRIQAQFEVLERHLIYVQES